MFERLFARLRKPAAPDAAVVPVSDAAVVIGLRREGSEAVLTVLRNGEEIELTFYATWSTPIEAWKEALFGGNHDRN